MQRSIINKKPLTSASYILFFIAYESLSSVYLFFPPLFAVLFVLFVEALEAEDSFSLFLISFCLLIYEADKGYMVFSSIIYFALMHKFVMPKIIQNFSCPSCVKISYMLIAYVGFFLFSTLLANVFLIPAPSVNYYIIYYIVIEFFLVSLL